MTPGLCGTFLLGSVKRSTAVTRRGRPSPVHYIRLYLLNGVHSFMAHVQQKSPHPGLHGI